MTPDALTTLHTLAVTPTLTATTSLSTAIPMTMTAWRTEHTLECPEGTGGSTIETMIMSTLVALPHLSRQTKTQAMNMTAPVVSNV